MYRAINWKSCLKRSSLEWTGLGNLYIPNISFINNISTYLIPFSSLSFPIHSELLLPYNQLNTLPYSVGWLHSLNLLDLDHNALRYLPMELSHLSDVLKDFHLEDNATLEVPPRNIANKGATVVLGYLRTLSAGIYLLRFILDQNSCSIFSPSFLHP